MTGNSEWFFNFEREETRRMEQRERAAEIIKENKCKVCGGKHYVVSRRDDGRRAVERCDGCFVCTTDLTAAVLAQADGIDCELTYPCFVLEHQP